jgi:hypothetical protein
MGERIGAQPFLSVRLSKNERMAGVEHDYAMGDRSMAFAFAPIESQRISLTPTSTGTFSLPVVGRNVRIANLGPSDARIKFTATFTSTGINTLTIMARTVEIFDRQANGFIAGIGVNGSTVLDVTTGEGE